jgi:SAM-dependent methyltransferase
MDINEKVALPPALSITHLHLLACTNTLLRTRNFARPIRVLDVGCGNGELIAYLSAALPVLQPGCMIEIHGLDVGDSGVQASGFFARTRERLNARMPDVDWEQRLSLVTSCERWPYPDGYFDFIVSNQVLEHVADHNVLFGEVRRTLCDGGFSVHLFPLVHYIQEGHIHIPLAHRIRRHGLLRSYIALMSRLGFGSYREHRRAYGMTIEQYAEEHADYLTFMTNYLSAAQLRSVTKRNGLRADFRYTTGFYAAKLRAVLRRSPQLLYAAPRPWRDALAFFLLKRVSSVTLVLEKKQNYAR